MSEDRGVSQLIDSRSKGIKKNKFPVDVEAERKFDGLKRKYANAIAYLLVKNIARRDLKFYFEANDDNRRRFDTIKRFRQEIIDSRPKARLWVDKPFYIKLDVGEVNMDASGSLQVSIVLGECVFRQPTNVIGSKRDLEEYMETIAKIIDSEKVWADPDMADFDIGEREYLATATVTKKPKAAAAGDELKLESDKE